MSDTRTAAYQSAKDRASVVRDKCLKALSNAMLTADEVAEKIGENILTVRPRITELGNGGYIRKTALRRKNKSGRAATVWMLAG